MKSILTIIYLLIIAVPAEAGGMVYKDMMMVRGRLWCLTSTGTLRVYDIARGDTMGMPVTTGHGAVVMCADTSGAVVIADRRGEVKRYDERKHSWDAVGRCESKDIYGIVCNSRGMLYAICGKGVEDVKTSVVYSTTYDGEGLNKDISVWGEPTSIYIDHADRIWVGYGFGEWGGALYAYSTVSKNYIRLASRGVADVRLPVMSVFGSDSSVYYSSGLQHMFTSGCIVRLTNKNTPVILFESRSKRNNTGSNWNGEMIPGQYIGPAAFNTYNGSIYYYSQDGFFRGDIRKDLSHPWSWQLIIKPKLSWEWGQSNAVGSPMNVKKIVIIDKDRFAFLPAQGGIGYYDGSKVVMLQ